MGKGSTPRPFTDREQYERNHEAIFGKKQPANHEAEQKEQDDVSTANRAPDC